MLARSAAVAAFLMLVGCAGVESVGRGAERAPPPPQAAAPEIAPPAAVPGTDLPPVAAANVPAPEATVPPRPRGDNEIIVPGQVERQVPAPQGDPRSMSQRMEDVRAWDRCVTEVQSAFESDPMRPQLDTPEEYCRRSLGMADRLSVPASRRR